MKRLIIFTLILVLLSCSVYAANFTSVQTGSWDDGATWGNTSPGVKGTDWPGLAGDTFTIAVGHIVKYNVIETNELGASTVNGTLWIPLDADTKLTFGNVDFTIGATGVLITSSDGTIGNIGVVDKAKYCYVIWNTTADNSKGPVITDGAYIDVRGDTSLYGGTHTTTLAVDWTAGQTLTATGTAPLSWVAGQTFTIARNTGNGVATTLRYTIASVAANGANTDITISEAAPGISFVAGGQIFNEARNVKIYKLGAETPAMDTIYTNRPRVVDNHITGTVKWTDVQFTGFYFYDGVNACTGGSFEFTNTIHRNCYYGLYRIKNAVLTGCSVYSNSNGFYSGTSFTLTDCSVYSNYNGFYSGTSFTLTDCSVYSNSNGFCRCVAILFKNGTIGWNGVVSAPNTTDFSFPQGEIQLQNCKAPAAGYTFANRNDVLGYRGVLVCDEYNQSPGDWWAYGAYGTITKVASPAGYSNPYCQKAESLSNCAAFPMYFMGGEKEIPGDGLPFYIPAGVTSVKVKVQTSGFTVVPTNIELYFEVQYYNTATSELTIATSTTVVDANDTTKEFTIAVSPNRSDKAFIRGILKKYEAGAYVLCDMIPVVVQ